MDFKPRKLEFRAKTAARLLGNGLLPSEMKKFVERPKGGDTYQYKYTGNDLREIRAKLGDDLAERVRLKGMPPVLVSRLSKGGVGKTTIAANLAAAYAAAGFKVCAIDGDPQASLSTIFGIDDEDPNLKTLRDAMKEEDPLSLDDVKVSIYEDATLHLIPADLTMNRLETAFRSERSPEGVFTRFMKKNEAFFKQYDIILIDTNPGSTMLNFNFMLAASLVVGVVSMDGMSIKAIKALIADMDDIREYNNRVLPFMLVPNMYSRAMKHSDDNFNKLKLELKDHTYPTAIPTYAGFGRQVRLREDGVPDAAPLFESEMTSVASEAIIDLGLNILNMFDSKAQGEPVAEMKAA